MAATRDILLQTPHLKRATAFYRDWLGMSVFLTTPTMVGLDAGGFRLLLEEGEALGPLLEFTVDDLPAERRRLLDSGCVVLAEDEALQRLYLRDPFGMSFQVTARGDAPDPSGDEAEAIRESEPPPHY